MKYIFLLITWFCGSFGILSAQEIQVKSFQKLDRDLEARTQPRLDLNDNPCSIIKVVTTGEDFQFEGNTIGDPVYRKGEVIVYMTERSRRLTIKHEKYGVIRYEFPQLIGKQEVYELVVKLVEDKNNKLRTLVMPNLSYGSSRLSYGIMIGIVKKTGGYIKMKSDFGSISSEEEVDKNTVDTYCCLLYTSPSPRD